MELDEQGFLPDDSEPLDIVNQGINGEVQCSNATDMISVASLSMSYIITQYEKQVRTFYQIA